MTDDLYHSGMDDDILSIRILITNSNEGIVLNIVHQVPFASGRRVAGTGCRIELDDYRSYNRSKRSGLENK